MTPSIAPARPLAGRVQGAESHLDHIVLHDGRSLRAALGDAVVSQPKLIRSMGGRSSTISLDVYDPELRLQEIDLLATKFDVTVDGLRFRYIGTSKRGNTLSLTFEDWYVARMREFFGPKSFYRKKYTRAEAIVSLVREVHPRAPITCPELHVKQPVASKREGERAKDRSRNERGHGLGDVKGLTVKGDDADSAQVALADRALRVAEEEKAPFAAMVALMAALIVESEVKNLTGGDGSSSGALQVTSETAALHGVDPRDVEQVCREFLRNGYASAGGAIKLARQGKSPGEIAQLVQGSAFPERYGEFAGEAREWVEEFLGGTSSVDTEEDITLPYKFEIDEAETYWHGIDEWAKDVNWRAFWVAGRFFYISEPDLLRGEVRHAIDRDTDFVENVDYNYLESKPATEVTVTAYARKWAAPPGSVATLEGYGPASIGFGDAPVEADKKGRRAGISDNRVARTGVGRARYLVPTIEVPLSPDLETRLATIKLRKPTSPLPEPRPETRSVDRSSTGKSAGGGDGPDSVQITRTSPGDPYWGGVKALFHQFIDPFMEEHGLKPGARKEGGHAAGGDHDPSQTRAYATDYPTTNGEAIARELAQEFGWDDWRPNSYASKVIEVDGLKIQMQILWGAEIEHGDHVHVGGHVV